MRGEAGSVKSCYRAQILSLVDHQKPLIRVAVDYADMMRDWMLALEGLMRAPFVPRSDARRSEVDQLRREVMALGAFRCDDSASASAWAENANELRNHILNDDPTCFLQWDVIRRTMFVRSGPFVRTELTALGADPDWGHRWRAAVTEDRFGKPSMLPRYRASSGNRVHHAYHIREFERSTGTSLGSIDCVFEFGGGFGGMAHLLRRLGFRGRHVILDLPMFSALQRFYLRTVLPDQDRDIYCVDEPSRAFELLAGKHRLMIATWSFSEVPAAVRESVSSLVNACNHFLVAFQERFEELDNAGIATSMSELAPISTVWWEWPINHLPGNRYLMGRPSTR